MHGSALGPDADDGRDSEDECRDCDHGDDCFVCNRFRTVTVFYAYAQCLKQHANATGRHAK